MIHFIFMLLIAVFIGILTDASVQESLPGGVVGSMIVGFAGAWLGTFLLGSWGPGVSGFSFFPAVLGSISFLLLICLLSKATGRTV